MNRMYLVCTHHPNQVDALLLAERASKSSEVCTRNYEYRFQPNDRSIDKWLSKHAACGGGFDHFTIAYALPKDHDVPKPAPVANAVHLALVTSEAKRIGPDMSHVSVEIDDPCEDEVIEEIEKALGPKERVYDDRVR